MPRSLAFLRGSLPLAAMSRILIKSSWGSDDPTKGCFAFLRANQLAQAGHDVQIFLQGEAVGLLRDSLAEKVVPVGGPPLKDILPRTIELGVRIHL
jgi:predicted peroxiredoxin